MWLCNCGLKNSGLNQNCAARLTRLSGEHYQISSNKPDFWQATVIANEVLMSSMTPNEELFAKFYNHEKLLVKDMDVVQLRTHREELAKIAFEAKARLVAADDEGRERKAKTDNKQWLVSSDEVLSTDAINAPKIRKDRMSKIDKMREQLLKAGIEEATVNEMIGNLEKKATERNLKTVTFNKPTVEISAVQVAAAKPVDDSPKVAFNPSALVFGVKK